MFLAGLGTLHMFFFVSQSSRPCQNRSKMKVLLKNNLVAAGKENTRRAGCPQSTLKGGGTAPSPEKRIRIFLKLFLGGP